MSDFLEYYKREEQKRAMSEEELLELHKKQKAIRAERYRLDEDDDFYNEEIDDEPIIGEAEGTRVEDNPDEARIDEGARVPYRHPAPRPVPRPAPRPVQPPAPPVPAPAQPQVPDFPDDDIDEPVQVPNRRKRHNLRENTANPALERAYRMMDEMQQKIENAFYRYGMSGLEKINRHMEKIFEAIISPPRPKPVIKYIEKPVQTVGESLRAGTAPVRKPAVQKTYDEPSAEENYTEPEIIDESEEIVDTNEQLNKEFIALNETADSSMLSNVLLKQGQEQQSKGRELLSRIEANAKLMQESIDKAKAPEPAQEQVQEEEPVQQEDFEIVDDPVMEPPVKIVEDPKPKPAAQKVKKTGKKAVKKTK